MRNNFFKKIAIIFFVLISIIFSFISINNYINSRLYLLEKGTNSVSVEVEFNYIYILTVAVSLITALFFIISYFWNRNLQNEITKKTIELDSFNKQLEAKVIQRTVDLEKSKEAAMSRAYELDNIKRSMLNVLEDIKYEKDVADLLKKRLELATQSARIGIMELDLAKNTLSGDSICCDIYGLPHNIVNEMPFDEWKKIIHKEDLPNLENKLQKTISSGELFDHVFRVMTGDSSIRYVRGVATVEKDDSGNLIKVIGANFDVTKEVEIDKAKTEFVSLASHQLKTPVGAVKWNSEMLLSGDYGPLKPAQKDVVKEIYELNVRMTDLINSFLNITRIELGTVSIEPEPVDYVSVCEDVLLELKKRIKDKGHKITKEYQKDLPKMIADPKSLRIIFQNLLSNAVKYTNEKGKIGISIGTDAKNIVISVSNNGIPIPKNEQSKIFGKLFRATGAQEMDTDGSGLGLYLLKSLVENAGGTVSFQSEESKDTVFTVTFPLPGMKKKEGSKTLS